MPRRRDAAVRTRTDDTISGSTVHVSVGTWSGTWLNYIQSRPAAQGPALVLALPPPPSEIHAGMDQVLSAAYSCR